MLEALVHELLVLFGGACLGVVATVAAMAWLGARRERAAVRAVIAELVVLDKSPTDGVAHGRAREAVALWSERAADLSAVDHRLLDLGMRLVRDVARAYDRAPTDVRLSQAARVVARLLDEDLSGSLRLLERYATVSRVLHARDYLARAQRWSQENPRLVAGLRWANWARVWGLRAYRLASRRIPSLLLFEAAGKAADLGAREYVGAVLADLTGRVGKAAVELYAGAGATLAERRLVGGALELLLLEALAREGTDPGDAERQVLAGHRDARELPREALDGVLLQLAATPGLDQPGAIGALLEASELLDESARRLVEMCDEGSPERQAREAAWLAARAAMDRAANERAAEPAGAAERAETRPEPGALLRALWEDLAAEPELVRATSLAARSRDELAAVLARDPLFVRAADRWLLGATRDEALYVYPVLRKMLWLAGRSELERADAPPDAALRAIAQGLGCPADAGAIAVALSDRFARRQASWLTWLSPGRLGRQRLRGYAADDWLLDALTGGGASR